MSAMSSMMCRLLLVASNLAGRQFSPHVEDALPRDWKLKAELCFLPTQHSLSDNTFTTYSQQPRVHVIVFVGLAANSAKNIATTVIVACRSDDTEPVPTFRLTLAMCSTEAFSCLVKTMLQDHVLPIDS
jgi:hypothetical protein